MDLKQSLRNRSTRAISIVLAFVSVFLITALYYTQNPFLEAFEARTYDLRFKSLRGPIRAHPDIAIIAIDDKSIKELGRFPWSRQQYVRLLDRLSEAAPKAVLFDAFFPEPESAEVDQAFADAIRRAGNVVLATTFEFDRQSGTMGSTGSLEQLEQAAAGLGHINLIPEDDGVNRRNLLLIEKDGKQVPSLGLMGAMVALGVKEFSASPFQIRAGEHLIPVGRDAPCGSTTPAPPAAIRAIRFPMWSTGGWLPRCCAAKHSFWGPPRWAFMTCGSHLFTATRPGWKSMRQ
jgi:adenylate cyclase